MKLSNIFALLYTQKSSETGQKIALQWRLENASFRLIIKRCLQQSGHTFFKAAAAAAGLTLLAL